VTFNRLSPSFSAAPQLSKADVALAAEAGFRTIIDSRPDGEEAGQLSAPDMEALAKGSGLAFVHIPVTLGAISEEDVARMRTALEQSPGPVLGYCRSGTRAAMMWALTQVGRVPAETLLKAGADAGYELSSIKARLAAKPTALNGATARGVKTYDVVIVGGGSAGVATAASLLKRNDKLSIAIIEPASEHFYQPGWTMVGAGVFSPEQTRHTMQSVMPDRVTWIRQAASGFSPETNEAILADGTTVSYRVLVAAPGLKLDWAAIPGLAESLGKNGVTSNYRYDLAPYTYEIVRTLKRGRALFTQPPMPIKCAGAPQKAMYLSCDLWRDADVLSNIEVEFHNAGAALFGVAAYVPALMEYVKRYGIALKPESKLVAVDGAGGAATFEDKIGDQTTRVERGFDMLHAVPPQVAPDFVRSSPIAGPAGFIDVDPATMRHARFPNIYALGDACSTPNAKTMAAARKQAPIVAVNVLATLAGHEPMAIYDGYGSCPLTVERGKIVLAEFGYGGKLIPTFPKWLLDGTKPSRLAWFLKAKMLPPVYWDGMLKGREWLANPHQADGRAAA
jgi:sulfide:quinone oxidoreductase